MTRTWVEHPQARTELIDTALYLDTQHPGLGDDLLTSVERAAEAVLDSPASWPPLPYWDGATQLRSKAISPFRLQLIYFMRGSSVRVVAYAHESREPGYWAHRLST